MKFKISKYGIILAAIYAGYFLFIFIVDPSETGPLGFLQYLSLLFFLPVFIITALIPVEIPRAVSFIIGLLIFYFIGAGIQKFSKKRKS